MKIENRLLTILFLLSLFIFSNVKPQDNPNFSWLKIYSNTEDLSLGIWPNYDYWNDVTKLKRLKNIFGFNEIVSRPLSYTILYDNVRSAGYDNSEIMFQIFPDLGSIDYVFEQYPEVGYYYIDEPAERGYTSNWYNTRVDSIKANTSNSLMVISGYKRNDKFRNYSKKADVVMYSSYKHWWEIFGIWLSCCPEDPDQRPDWENMQGIFNTKFSSTWIGAHRDEKEYDNLLGKARNLGLNSVWLYALQLEGSQEFVETNFNKFANAAVKWGFLSEKYQAYREIEIPNSGIITQYIGLPFEGEIPTIFNYEDYMFANYTVSNDRVEDFFAFNTITVGYNSIFFIDAQKQASLNAPKEIRIGPGFEAKRGSEFRAFIGE